MLISCCAWALTQPESVALPLLQGVGLRSIDIRPSMLRSDPISALRQSLGLAVSCIAASHESPAGASFDSADAASVAALERHVKDAIDHAASLGTGWAYLVPEARRDAGSLRRYADHLGAVADHGQRRGVKVCVEHFPGTALPTVAATLELIRTAGHPNLYLLFDIGHAQMAGEDPAQVLAAAGDRLGYVHLDDNDGVADLHLGLTEGVQTRASLVELFAVLQGVGYEGPVSLEMKSDLADPLAAIRRSYDLVVDILGG